MNMNFYSKNGITVHSILDFSLRAIFRKNLCVVIFILNPSAAKILDLNPFTILKKNLMILNTF